MTKPYRNLEINFYIFRVLIIINHTIKTFPLKEGRTWFQKPNLRQSIFFCTQTCISISFLTALPSAHLRSLRASPGNKFIRVNPVLYIIVDILLLRKVSFEQSQIICLSYSEMLYFIVAKPKVTIGQT